ncbi:MAG: hypothetical protein J2O49_09960, partial [Sciscionella sp.]|nr:hypothetical protein [Sciscionella sp.]
MRAEHVERAAEVLRLNKVDYPQPQRRIRLNQRQQCCLGGVETACAGQNRAPLGQRWIGAQQCFAVAERGAQHHAVKRAGGRTGRCVQVGGA